MQFPKANSFPRSLVLSKIMGPNPLKLCEEMLSIVDEVASSGVPGSKTAESRRRAIPQGSVVLDLGSGTGITTALLAREYGYVAYGADLWSDPSENMRFFEELGLSNRRIIPMKIDASQGLPFAEGFFDAVVSTDSYNYFGRDTEYLGTKLLPYVKKNGLIAVCIPGMKRDCHSNPPACLFESWTPEQLDFIHDIPWWRKLLQRTEGIEILEMREMQCTEEAWSDWLQCENEYAQGDKAAVEAGALEYLNTITVVMRKR